MRKTDSTEKLTTLIKAATSPFHTAAAIVKELRTAGFEPLVMNRPWQLEAGGKYYVEQYGSAVVAFTVGDQVQAEGFRFSGAQGEATSGDFKRDLCAAECGSIWRCDS